VAVQLSALPWLGWIPDDLGACPAAALDRLATALAIAPDSAAGAVVGLRRGWQGRTRREHRAQVLARLGWRWCAAGERKRRMLAEVGRRSTNQALQRADASRRYPVLLATLAETYIEVLDELVQLLGQALAGADSRARHELSQRLVDPARTEADRARLLDEIPDVLADPGIPDEQTGQLVRQRLGMPRLAARRPAEDREQRDHGHFDLLAARYKHLRTFTPAVIRALPLAGNTASPDVAALLEAVGVPRGLNAAGRTTTVPAEAATANATVFVPARWRGYLDTTGGQGHGAGHSYGSEGLRDTPDLATSYWPLVECFGRRAEACSTRCRKGHDPMTVPQNTPAGFARLIQLWTIQLRRITGGLTGMAGLSESVLAQSVQSLQGLPHPGALSAAQLNLIASSVASQRQGIAATQAQLRVLDEQLAMLEQILGPLAEWGKAWAQFEGLVLPARRDRGPEG